MHERREGVHDSFLKIRIYDLAKELKLDTKRLIEEVRREGVDVSVPSNSVSKELAEKIRNKYFPKKETAVKRAVKVVKRAALPTPEAPVVEALSRRFTNLNQLQPPTAPSQSKRPFQLLQPVKQPITQADQETDSGRCARKQPAG